MKPSTSWQLHRVRRQAIPPTRILHRRLINAVTGFVHCLFVAALMVIFTMVNEAAAIPSFDKLSKGELTTTFTGSGWPPNTEIEIFIGEPPAPLNPPGVIMTDANGNFSTPWLNTDSRAASLTVGMVVGARALDPSNPNMFLSSTVTAVRDPRPSIWSAILGLIDFLTSKVENTELGPAGFVANSFALTSVSPNALLVSQNTIFDAAIDTVTTVGSYNLLELGPVFGTYTAAGTFTHLFDPGTGSLLPPLTDSFQFTEQIGNVVPEPSSAISFGTGFLLLVWYVWRRRRRGVICTA